MTTYRHQDFIAQTIESILAQTHTDWELLIGDDSPDDATWNIIQGYVNQYPDKIKARHHSLNKGIVDNMSFLIAQTSQDSEYIAFLEGDDMYVSNNLEEKMKIFEQYPELGMVYSNFSTIDSKSNVRIINGLKDFVLITRYVQNETLSKIDFLNGNYYLSYSTIMITKTVNTKFPIRSIPEGSMSYVSDWDMFFRISTNSYIYGIEEPLTLYRIHENNFSRMGGNIINGLYTLKEYYVSSKEITATESESINSFLGKLAIGSTFAFQIDGKFSKARSAYCTSRKYDKRLSIEKVKGFLRFFMPVVLQKYIYKTFFFKHG